MNQTQYNTPVGIAFWCVFLLGAAYGFLAASIVVSVIIGSHIVVVALAWIAVNMFVVYWVLRLTAND